MPCTLPLGLVSGVLQSACASSQTQAPGPCTSPGRPARRSPASGRRPARARSHLPPRTWRRARRARGRRRDLGQVLGVDVQELERLELRRRDVAEVAHLAAELLEALREAAVADRGGPHVDAAAALPEVDRRADDVHPPHVGGRVAHALSSGSKPRSVPSWPAARPAGSPSAASRSTIVPPASRTSSSPPALSHSARPRSK